MKDKRKITRIGFVADESFNYFITIFVTGTLLGYITSSLGFTDAEQGIISGIPTLCLAAQLLAPLFAGRRVKKLITFGMLIAHLSFLLIYVLPLIPNGAEYGFVPILVIILLMIGNFINNALNSTRLVWLMKSVDNDKRGSFTAVKEMISLAFGIIISILVGVLADTLRKGDGTPSDRYYVTCAIIIGAFVLLNVLSLAASDEQYEPSALQSGTGCGFVEIIKNSVVLKIIVIDVLWYFANGISTAFHASYLREDLAFNFTTITVITALTSLCRFFASPIMGRIGDKYGFKTTMLICFVLKGIAFLAVVFTAPGHTRWFYVAYSAFAGLAMAGINSGLMNLVYDYVRPEQRSGTLGLKGAVGGVVGFLSTLLGGVILEAVQANGGLRILGTVLEGQQVLSAVSVAVVILLVVYIRLVVYKMKRVDI